MSNRSNNSGHQQKPKQKKAEEFHYRSCQQKTARVVQERIGFENRASRRREGSIKNLVIQFRQGQTNVFGKLLSAFLEGASQATRLAQGIRDRHGSLGGRNVATATLHAWTSTAPQKDWKVPAPSLALQSAIVEEIFALRLGQDSQPSRTSAEPLWRICSGFSSRYPFQQQAT